MKTITKLAAAMLLGAGALGLAGCATGLNTKVSRYQEMPAPAGQSFFVVPLDPRQNGSLEFKRFAGYVVQAMSAQGYAQAASPQTASLIVNVGYGVDEGTTEYVSYPSFGHGYGGYGYGGYGFGGWPYYSRHRGFRSAYYYGWDDPFWYGGGGISSYTRYTSNLDIDIRRRADNQSVFEGHAKARSTSDDLNRLVPNLIDAMFTGFPGRDGETVKITVPPPRRVAQATRG